MKFGRNVVTEEPTQKKTNQDENKKSAINKKINSQIKKPHLKMIPIKDNDKFGTDPTFSTYLTFFFSSYFLHAFFFQNLLYFQNLIVF